MLKNVKELAVKFLNNYKEVNLSPNTKPIEKILQKIVPIEQALKLEKLKSILEQEKIYQAIIFTRTKKRADNLAKALNKNKFNAMSFHGDKRQSQRTRILKSFKRNDINFLIATDVAARGIDIDDIKFIINYDLPTQPEIYVHRIGRTARAGKNGTAISFCDETECKRLKEIEKLIGLKFNIELPINHKKKDIENTINKKYSRKKVKKISKKKFIKSFSPKKNKVNKRKE